MMSAHVVMLGDVGPAGDDPVEALQHQGGPSHWHSGHGPPVKPMMKEGNTSLGACFMATPNRKVDSEGVTDPRDPLIGLISWH